MTKNIYTNEMSFKSQFISQSLILSKFNETKNQTLKEMSTPFKHVTSVSKNIIIIYNIKLRFILIQDIKLSTLNRTTESQVCRSESCFFNIFGLFLKKVYRYKHIIHVSGVFSMGAMGSLAPAMLGQSITVTALQHLQLQFLDNLLLSAPAIQKS